MNTDLLLKNISKHITLDKEEEEFFISLLKIKKIKRKEYLLRAGEICRFDYFVNKGCLRSYYPDENGHEHNAMFAIEGWWTGNLHSFLTNTLSRYSVEALEDVELLQIDRESLELLYQKVPKFERFFRLISQNALITQESRVMNHLSFTAKERYSLFTQKYPGLEQRIAQKHIASYLGITPEFLSRLRKNKKK